MNLSLQGRDVTVSDVKDKLAGLTVRMEVWQARIKVGSTFSICLLERRLKMNKIDLPDNIKTCIMAHLEIVSAECRSFFIDGTLHVSWHGDPFNIEIDPNSEEAKDLAEFKISYAMKLGINNRADDSSFGFLFMIHIHYSARRFS